jgi:hypothetical protein
MKIKSMESKKKKQKKYKFDIWGNLSNFFD